MKKNVGGLDRILRVSIGVIVVLTGVYFQSWWGLIGLAPIFTGTIGWCPAYVPFGISSCKCCSKNEEQESP